MIRGTEAGEVGGGQEREALRDRNDDGASARANPHPRSKKGKIFLKFSSFPIWNLVNKAAQVPCFLRRPCSVDVAL
jgi:hypothetical protein